MIDLGPPTQPPYTDPWLLPVGERLRTLARGGTRVAYFYEKADNSTFRYRVYNMAQVLNHEGDVSAAYFFLADIAHLEQIADLADLLVICRTRYDHHVQHVIAAFHKRGKRVLFDVDDLVFDTRYVHVLARTIDVALEQPEQWDVWFAYISRIGETLRLCDAGITTNTTLAARMQEFVDIPVRVVPNFVNREQLEVSDAVFAQKAQLAPAMDGLVHFGYFSGSPSHNHDFAIALPALEAALEQRPYLGLAIAGYMQPERLVRRFGHRVHYFPFVDYVQLQRLVGGVEFNLMPLQSNAFTQCKSELKYFEAAIAGTVSIASPVGRYAQAIRHGETGYLAAAHEWLAVLLQAVDEMASYRAMATRAREDALASFTWRTQRATILAALGLEG